MQNHYRLNLNFKPYSDTFQFPVSGVSRTRIHTYDSSVLSPECIEWINKVNLEFKKVLVFEQPPGRNQRNIHIDGRGHEARRFGINWNFNTDDFEMRWYKALRPGYVHSKDNTTGFTFNEEDVELIETSRTTDPVLFRTDIPHAVMNFNRTTRYSMSLVFHNRPEWITIVTQLKDYIKDNISLV